MHGGENLARIIFATAGARHDRRHRCAVEANVRQSNLGRRHADSPSGGAALAVVGICVVIASLLALASAVDAVAPILLQPLTAIAAPLS